MKCIFCGNEVEHYVNDKEGFIICRTCRIAGPGHARIEYAEKEWAMVLHKAEMFDELVAVLKSLIPVVDYNFGDAGFAEIVQQAKATLAKANREDFKNERIS